MLDLVGVSYYYAFNNSNGWVVVWRTSVAKAIVIGTIEYKFIDVSYYLDINCFRFLFNTIFNTLFVVNIMPTITLYGIVICINPWNSV